MTALVRACAASCLAVFPLTGASAQENGGSPPPMFVAPASDEGLRQIASFRLAPGLVCELVAAEPHLCNGVAFAIDGRGRFFVAESFRINDGVPDTRDHMDWKDEDLACLTVADRVTKYEKHLPNEITRYTAFSERIRLLADTDGDGKVDRSTVFADGFRDLADGIASGVLPVGDAVYFTNIPKLWRLVDRDGDGVADERQVLHDGYGVHSSLIGHDLHGLILGPDRRLWFSIGDRGFHVQQGDRTLAYPHEGAVLRCELDGSDLEVVHRGLRNPQELAFDQWGDLFTCDNNSDGGDRARIVQVVPGADSGWRIGYQWLSDRGAWNREGMWKPRHPGQPVWILPPIANFADGPSGLAYDTGIGMPERFRDCFFLCDFRGGSSYSGVTAFRLQRSGAGFELTGSESVVHGVLATDVDFGPDGAMYVLDWVHGWSKTGKGRIYRVQPTQRSEAPGDSAALLGRDLANSDDATLRLLLEHPDRRVRQAAQFALVDHGATDVLADVARNGGSRIARVHAIFGLGILGRRDANAVASVTALLRADDGDVRATAARVLGDVRRVDAAEELTRALDDGSSRVRREAALALARIGAPAGAAAGKALLAAVRANDDHDPVLRHAFAFALSTIAAADTLHAAAADPAIAVRRGVLLAMARQGDPAIASFLADAEESLRFEAARAIHGEAISGAMRALALLTWNDDPDTERIDLLAISANRLIGQVENGESLVHLACLQNHPAATRIEALRVLAEWAAPHGQDRITGNWRPCTHEGSDRVAGCLEGSADRLLADDVTAAEAAIALAALRRAGAAQQLLAVAINSARPEAARIAALNALDVVSAAARRTALDTIDGSAPVALRRRAIELLSRDEPARAVPVLESLLENAPRAERQSAFAALGAMEDAAATEALVRWLGRLDEGRVDPALELDLLEAAERHTAPAVSAWFDAHDGRAGERGALADYAACREGGDPEAGRKVFFDNEATRCTRCHTLDGRGGNAGPALDGIGKRATRDHLIESLVLPGAKIAEGFGSTTVELDDGGVLVGVVTKDEKGSVTVVGADSEPHAVPWERIRRRTSTQTSAMPPMGGALSRRQLRDLVAFLAER
ncbi:MAG: HEAT repeat domain-containing protein [Planctomycetes bacterium]|nr:HEAT repeat domain-containing protein [Planctomycetota bacterium]